MIKCRTKNSNNETMICCKQLVNLSSAKREPLKMVFTQNEFAASICYMKNSLLYLSLYNNNVQLQHISIECFEIVMGNMSFVF